MESGLPGALRNGAVSTGSADTVVAERDRYVPAKHVYRAHLRDIAGVTVEP